MCIFVRIAAIFIFVVATSLCVHSSESNSRVIVLTFDDGPREQVLAGQDGLLAFLLQENIRATFFVQGWQASKNSDLVRTMIQSGHSIANHTYGHATPREWAKILARKNGKDWRTLSRAEQDAYRGKGKEKFVADVERGRVIMQSITGYSPIFMRPPKWDIDQDIYCKLSQRYIVQMIAGVVHEHACSKGTRIFHDVNTGDYEVIASYVKGVLSYEASVHALTTRVRKLVARREVGELHIHVLVFHEHSITVEALRILVSEWKKQGIRFMNLHEVYGL